MEFVGSWTGDGVGMGVGLAADALALPRARCVQKLIERIG